MSYTTIIHVYDERLDFTIFVFYLTRHNNCYLILNIVNMFKEISIHCSTIPQTGQIQNSDGLDKQLDKTKPTTEY